MPKSKQNLLTIRAGETARSRPLKRGFDPDLFTTLVFGDGGGFFGSLLDRRWLLVTPTDFGRGVIGILDHLDVEPDRQ